MILRWWQLAIRNWRARLGRSLAESLAVAVACALVVLLTCCFDSLEQAMWTWHGRWIGRVDIRVEAPRGGWLDESVLARVRAVDGVAAASARLEERAMLVGPSGRVSAVVKGKTIPSDADLHPQDFLAGRQVGSDEQRETVISRQLAETLGVEVGDAVEIRIYDRAELLTVVGIVDRPPLFSFVPMTAHVPMNTAQALFGRQGRVDTVYVRARPEEAVGALAGSIATVLGPGYEIRITAHSSELVLGNIRLVRMAVVVLSSLLFVLATVLIFATLAGAMVTRVAQLGTLRCVGASRRQLAGLVIAEAMPMAVVGLVLGAPVGLVGSWLVVRAWPEAFVAGWTFSGWGLAMAAGGAIAAVLVGALLPAWTAWRIPPIQAQRLTGRAGRWWAAPVAGAAGVALLAFPAALLHNAGELEPALYRHALFGVPAMIAGVFLLAPLVLTAMAWSTGSPLGAVVAVDGRLLGRQVVRHRWRAAAVVTALAVCVAMMISAPTQTESLIAGRSLPTEFPDLLVIAPMGVSRAEAVTAMNDLDVSHWAGLNGFDIMLVGEKGTVPQKPVLPAMMGWRGGNCWFLSVDPDQMDNVMKLRFVQGDAVEAVNRLTQGDAVIVADIFARRWGKGVGDRLLMRGRYVRPFEAEIVGVIDSASLRTASGGMELRELFVRSAAQTVLGSSAMALDRFNYGGYSMLFIDVDTPTEGDSLAEKLRMRWRHKPIDSISLSRFRDRVAGEFRRLALIFTVVAGLLGGAVGTIGTANAMHAAVQGRRRELAVLHAVGMTRGALLRLVLGEAVIIGLSGTLLGLVVGLYAARLDTSLHALVLGQRSPVTVPWATILVAASASLVAVVVSAGPAAIRAGRVKVNDLQVDA